MRGADQPARSRDRARRSADQTLLSPREALQAIALFRLVLPDVWLRLAGGRERVLGELQAMGLLAGANALIVGNYLTTTGRSAEDDHALLDALGMPVADGPGEGRFVVDGDGAARPPARRRPSIPLTRRVRRDLTPCRCATSLKPRSTGPSGPGVDAGDDATSRRIRHASSAARRRAPTSPRP